MSDKYQINMWGVLYDPLHDPNNPFETSMCWQCRADIQCPAVFYLLTVEGKQSFKMCSACAFKHMKVAEDHMLKEYKAE